ncbi:glycosyltransferase family 4 protein, partial [Methylobrevis pamukkalensis]|uniref:glycosyltransferase family 4 protein n=1 Tax=Methylobrevis pamukkalensis TaxID=1439726 RepID=UPI00114D078C
MAAALDRLGTGTIPAASPRLAYYVQDYEPLFYPPGSPRWWRAFSSYGLLPGAIHFAKTDWIRTMVQLNHGVEVARVEPGLDRTVFFADPDKDLGGRPLLTAMVRPSTPRRGPRRTLRVLNRIAAARGDAVEIAIFGCADVELGAMGLDIDPAIRRLGVLDRQEAAGLLRHTDLFVDASDYQAFGRTAF